jgi:hypothetical protein
MAKGRSVWKVSSKDAIDITPDELFCEVVLSVVICPIDSSTDELAVLGLLYGTPARY